MRRLLAYDWPGNVRELKNYVECFSFTTEGDEILEEHLPPEVLNGASRSEECPATPSESGNFESLERAFLVDTMRKLGGNAVEAAKTLGVSRSTLYRKLKKHGISC
jgi:transcriptional regulator of acetoin/glycerol metabolism